MLVHAGQEHDLGLVGIARAPGAREAAGAEHGELAPARVGVVERPPAEGAQRVHLLGLQRLLGLRHRAAGRLAAGVPGDEVADASAGERPSSRARARAPRRSARGQQRRHLLGPVAGHDAVVLAADDERRRRDLGQHELDAVLEHGPEIRGRTSAAPPRRTTRRPARRPWDSAPRCPAGTGPSAWRACARGGSRSARSARASPRARDAARPSPRRPAHRSSARPARAGRCPSATIRSRDQLARLGHSQRLARFGCVAESRQVERVDGAGRPRGRPRARPSTRAPCRGRAPARSRGHRRCPTHG